MTGLAAGYCIGVVGDKGVRAYMEQSRVFVGMVLILIFGEVLGLYGYVCVLIVSDGLVLILHQTYRGPHSQHQEQVVKAWLTYSPPHLDITDLPLWIMHSSPGTPAGSAQQCLNKCIGHGVTDRVHSTLNCAGRRLKWKTYSD